MKNIGPFIIMAVAVIGVASLFGLQAWLMIQSDRRQRQREEEHERQWQQDQEINRLRVRSVYEAQMALLKRAHRSLPPRREWGGDDNDATS